MLSSVGRAAPEDVEDPIVELAPFLVTATHFETPAQSYPGSATILAPTQVGFELATDLRELLNYAPHVQFRSVSGSPADAEIALRGFGEGSGQRVLVLVDGLPLNRPDIGGMNWLQVPLNSVERVELLRGGQGVIYGSRAVAGVIKITTRRTGKGGELGMITGSYGLRQIDLWGIASPGPWSVSGSVSHHASEGYRARSNHRGESAQVAIGRAGDRASWRLVASASELEAMRPGPLISVGFPDNPRASMVPDQNFFERTADLRGMAEWEGEHVRFEVEGAARRRERDWNLSGVFGASENQTFQVSPRALTSFDRLELVTGVDAALETLNALVFPLPSRKAPYSDARLSRGVLAIYAHGRLEISETLYLSGGIRGEASRFRFDHDQDRANPFSPAPVLPAVAREKRSDEGWAWTAGAVWQPDSQWRGWIRVDRLYRYPLMDELASYQGMELAEPFNPDLEPESGHQVEAGVAWANDRMRLSLSAFELRLDQEILYDATISLNTNLPRTRRRGVEAEGMVFFPGGSVGASYTGVDARYRAGAYTGNRIYLVSPHIFGVFATYGRDGPVQGRIDGRYHAAQFEGNDFSNSRPKLPARFVADLSLTWRLNEAVRLTGAVLNVLDRQYASVKYLGEWYPEAGRTVRLGIHCTF